MKAWPLSNKCFLWDGTEVNENNTHYACYHVCHENLIWFQQERQFILRISILRPSELLWTAALIWNALNRQQLFTQIAKFDITMLLSLQRYSVISKTNIVENNTHSILNIKYIYLEFTLFATLPSLNFVIHSSIALSVKYTCNAAFEFY